jgi:predicted ATPase
LTSPICGWTGVDQLERRIIYLNKMISRLKAQNFKSLRSLDLTLGPLNVLVGPNMVGKSNIVDVFQFVYQLFFPESGTQGLMYALAQRGGINEVLWKGGYEKLVSIALEGEDQTRTKYKYSIEFIAGSGDFVTVQSESLKYTRDGVEIDLISQQQGMNKYVNLDGTVVGGVGTSGISAMQYAAPNWDGFKFCQWVKLWRFYHLVPTFMKQPSSMSLGQVLSPSGNNLSSWLLWLQTNSPESFARLNEVLHDLFPDVDRVRTIPTPDGNVHLAVTEKDLVRGPTGVWQTSDGFLVLTALLSLIYVPSTLSGTLFCIEEPENHLHPKLLETLVALLRQVRREVADAGGALSQLLITTQSPYLVNQLSIDEIIWVEKKQGQTSVQHLADKQNLRKLVEDEEFGLGELVFKGALGEK